MKETAIFLLNFFKEINFGGDTCQSIWSWQINITKSINDKSSLGKRQINAILQDTKEGVKDLPIETLKNLMLKASRQNIDIKLGKWKEIKLLNYCLQSLDNLTDEDKKLIQTIYDKHKSVLKITDLQRQQIEEL